MLRLLALLSTTVLLFSCATIKPEAPVAPTFSSISSNILKVSCTQCHGFMGGYNFADYQSTMKAVSAGYPESSPLYIAVNSGKMPKIGNHPSEAQIQAISDWITTGALDN